MFLPHHRIYYAGFILDFAVAMAIIGMPYFVFRQLGGSVVMSGVFGAAGAACYAGCCVVMTRFVSSPKNSLHWALGGTLFFLLMLFIMVLSREPIICGVCYGLSYVGLAAVWPALQGWIGASPSPEIRAYHLGWFNVAWSSGMAVGPLLAGPLIDFDFNLFAIAVGLFTILGFGLIWSLPHEKDYFPKVTVEQLEARAEHDQASERHLIIAWIATLLTNILVGVSRSIFPKRVNELISTGNLGVFFTPSPALIAGGNEATIYSWTAFCLCAGTAITFYLMGHSRAWKHNFLWLAGMQLAAAMAFWLLGYTSSLSLLCLASAIIGTALGFTFFASINYSVVNPEKKHKRATINEAMVGLGGCLGSIVFGYLVAEYGFQFSFCWIPVLVVILVLFEGWILRRNVCK